MSNEEAKAHDVAISLLDEDRQLAQRLYDLLSPALDVFFYSERQEKLAGTDGLQSFREPFQNSILNVVLCREGWGQTKWTAVEERSIKDRCFDGDWDSLFVIKVERDAAIPDWIPKTSIYLDLTAYTAEDAANAINGRVEERGRRARPDDAMTKATRLGDAKQFNQDRETALNGPRGVEAAASEVESLLDEIQALTDRIAQESPNLNLRAGTGAYGGHRRNHGVVATHNVGVAVNWHQHYQNTLRDSGLVITELLGRVKLPTERGTLIHQPEEYNREVYEFELSRAKGWCWRNTATGEEFTSAELADRAVGQAVELEGLVDAGELLPPWRRL